MDNIKCHSLLIRLVCVYHLLSLSLLQLNMQTTSKWQNNAHNSALQGTATSGNSKFTIVSSVGNSHDTGLGGTIKEISFQEHTFIRSESFKETQKIDSERMAQNRGNAMQRYKEKRKNRRHVYYLPQSYLFSVIVWHFWKSYAPECSTDMINTFAMNRGRSEPTPESEWRDVSLKLQKHWMWKMVDEVSEKEPTLDVNISCYLIDCCCVISNRVCKWPNHCLICCSKISSVWCIAVRFQKGANVLFLAAPSATTYVCPWVGLWWRYYLVIVQTHQYCSFKPSDLWVFL